MKEKYQLLLFKYLYQELNLQIVESLLIKNKFDFITSKNQMCDEEKLCYKYSKYFYLLNKINIDELNQEEKNYLEKISIDDKINNETITFLNNTINKVLFKDAKGYNLYYGPHSKQYLSKDNVIVLGLKYDQFGFAKGKLKKRQEIENNDKIITNILSFIQNHTKYPIQVILYNELYEKLSNSNMRILEKKERA